MEGIDVLLIRNYLKHTFGVDTERYELQFTFEGVTVLIVQICKDSRSETERLNTKEFRIPNTEYIRWKKIMGRSGKLKKIMEKNGQRFIG